MFGFLIVQMWVDLAKTSLIPVLTKFKLDVVIGSTWDPIEFGSTPLGLDFRSNQIKSNQKVFCLKSVIIFLWEFGPG